MLRNKISDAALSDLPLVAPQKARECDMSSRDL